MRTSIHCLLFFHNYYSMCNNVEEEFFFLLLLLLLPFFSFFSMILSDEASETFDSFDRLHFLFLISLHSKERKNQVTVTYRRLEKKKSTYLRKKRGNIYYSHHQIDAWLVQLILSLSLVFFFFFCSFVYVTAVRRFDVCLFFFFFFYVSLVCYVWCCLFFPVAYTNAIITLLDDLVDYFLEN